MQRSISSYALLCTSVSAILGSGWLFTMYYASTLAGPAVILSWIIGGAAVVVVAFVFAELCTMLPITGSSARIPQYTHGTLVSFLFSWMIWLSYVTLVPTEVQAILQYFSYFFSGLVHVDSSLTAHGYELALILMLLISALNVFSLRWLLICNNAFTIIKIIIPIFISLVVVMLFFKPNQLLHPNDSAFMPFGMQGVFSAIASGGIVFAFNGFKQACEMAGEAKNPTRTLPVAIIGSIFVCLIIYVLLQMAFLLSLHKSNLSHGWAHLILSGGNSPLAAILKQDHLPYLLPFVYLGAVIGPLAAGLVYASSAGRSLYGMSMNEQIPNLFQKLTAQGNPLLAIVTNFILGMCLFAPLPGWNSMITFLTALMSVTYGIGPVCVLALRRQMPEYHRPFKLPFVALWSLSAFYICTLLVYWSGWEIVSRLGVALGLGMLTLLFQRFWVYRNQSFSFNWRASIWIWPYFIGITLFSYLGNFGGTRSIPFGWDFVLIAVFCILILFLAVTYKLPSQVTRQWISEINELKLKVESV